MSVNKSTTHESKVHDHYKDVYPSDICQALDCNREAVHKISISAGTYGYVTLRVCKQCLKLFGR